ncbi:MAG: site-specific DNA-methyltransferase [Minisyncoccus archaeiphilus]|uniref:site-specific DNA-methyltransferase n=1 Tax=Minisyncoccus archaeiphilus TaxID=3238481 RepID=UPI002B11C38A|nr:MAG: site-specific DNA-methyltransferase [Candidatus Parcubacteria bacterium]
MKKLKMHTPNLTEGNIEKIRELFPNVITEKEGENGTIEKSIDFELLKQMLSDEIVEDDSERYRLDWPGKKASLLKANTPIASTLRPDRESSVNFDTTENIFIEGDNFEVLKILQESYLNKIKMIYIDPPYNTGKDFIYKDNFAINRKEYEEESGAFDEEGKLFKNTDTNGRFHSDWLSMMYERLLISRDLLKEDGVIFISIDDNEVHNLRKVCDEVFGENSFISIVPRTTSFQRSGQENYMNISHDYILVYSYSLDFYNVTDRIFNPAKLKVDKNGTYIEGDTKAIMAASSQGYSVGGDYDFEYKGKIYSPVDSNGNRNRWLWSKERMSVAAKLGILVETKNSLRMQLYIDKKFEEKTNRLVDKEKGLRFHTADFMKEKFDNPVGTRELKKIFNGKELFDNPKPSELIKYLLKMSTKSDDLILDFFSGSATTAHAVMQLNAEDGGDRKFIMVQLSEETDEGSEAYKAGYKTIAEIGKERIRRAGKKILEENKESLEKREKPLDIGFRVYKTDTTNMKDVYYHPSAVGQKDLLGQIDNIKEDRTAEDLLTQVMLDLGLTLDLPMQKKKIKSNDVYFVASNSLVACFDDKIDFSIIDDIANYKPLKVVFKDTSFKEEQDRTNLETRFKRLSPDTIITVL